MTLKQWRRLLELILAGGVILFAAFFLEEFWGGAPLTLPQKEAPLAEPIPEDLNEFLKLSMTDLNSATEEELVRLPGIGPVLASRILEYRAKNGPFESWEEVDRVEGVGARKIEAIQEEAFLGP